MQVKIKIVEPDVDFHVCTLNLDTSDRREYHIKDSQFDANTIAEIAQLDPNDDGDFIEVGNLRVWKL